MPHAANERPLTQPIVDDDNSPLTRWIPPREEKVWVPGYWSYGIRKVWREDHWHYETDREAKKWIEGHYQTQVVEPGHFGIRY